MFPDGIHLPCERVMVVILLPAYPSLCATSPVHPLMELGPAMVLSRARRENKAQKYMYKFSKYK